MKDNVANVSLSAAPTTWRVREERTSTIAPAAIILKSRKWSFCGAPRDKHKHPQGSHVPEGVLVLSTVRVHGEHQLHPLRIAAGTLRLPHEPLLPPPHHPDLPDRPIQPRFIYKSRSVGDKGVPRGRRTHGLWTTKWRTHSRRRSVVPIGHVLDLRVVQVGKNDPHRSIERVRIA